MKILIDATGVTRQKAGVGVYAKNLIHHLTEANRDMEIYLLVQDDDPELDFSGRPNVTLLRVPARYFRHLLPRFLLEQLCLPFLLWRLKIEVVHSLHYAFPYLTLGTRRVVTVHDMTFFSMPEVHERIKVLYFRFFIRAAGRSADAIVFISRSAQQDFVARLGEPRGSSHVIPHGKDEGLGPRCDPTQFALIRNKYAMPERFVLYIGTLEPRKNLERLLTSFSAVATEDASIGLVIAGKMGWMMGSLAGTVERLGLTGKVTFTGFILEEEKPILLSHCALFVYPSLYEGFGLPVLEALACGAPTITSRVSSLPEVAGDAALLIDPLDTSALSFAMASLLRDDALREGLRSRGFERAKQFTWRSTAEGTANVYRLLRNARPTDPV